MGSFRHVAERRKADIDILTHDKPPTGVAPERWLGPGESITFWRLLPHGAKARMISAAATVDLDRKGRTLRRRYDSGAALQARLASGIVAWTVFDGEGTEIPWDADNAAELLDGLPEEVYTELQRRVGAGQPPGTKDSDEAVDDTPGEDEDPGNASGASSAPSSTEPRRRRSGSATSTSASAPAGRTTKSRKPRAG